GSIVLDCFCGSGTTLKAAQINNRQWIGIDQSDLAIQVTREKLDEIEHDLFVSKGDYEFIQLDGNILIKVGRSIENLLSRKEPVEKTKAKLYEFEMIKI
ncbi:MAG: site-specific DNA-methyltransferase, partial [Dysgonamonadaceae bacterium]|nr:site-specific DNA-methyltransferase [Dysgonamonadaceae bacterium]